MLAGWPGPPSLTNLRFHPIARLRALSRRQPAELEEWWRSGRTHAEITNSGCSTSAVEASNDQNLWMALGEVA
ncbi:hypothetical protein GCM10009789_47120 [Kribbella sancticallisti]|uniref:Uncharacterized protein n=1 Tax=Kribbella sancticallisti TaxID=460087 RepID=A0ABN2DVP6_9ACTN